MSREWQPGDVALIPFGDGDHRAIRDEDGSWIVVGKANSRAYSVGRQLVVIDPEDREQVERLAAAIHNLDGVELDNNEPMTVRGLAMRAALRSLLAPPKPEEPTGLGAVVEACYEDAGGKGFGPCYWARTGDGMWTCLTDGLTRTVTGWPFLTAVRVLSEGVTA